MWISHKASHGIHVLFLANHRSPQRTNRHLIRLVCIRLRQYLFIEPCLLLLLVNILETITITIAIALFVAIVSLLLLSIVSHLILDTSNTFRHQSHIECLRQIPLGLIHWPLPLTLVKRGRELQFLCRLFFRDASLFTCFGVLLGED